jgi:DNA-binding NarL/FixJ family response regulator
MARVFLCEDDPSFRLLTRLRLESLGHEVVGEAGAAHTCAEGIVGADADVALIDGLLERPEDWARLRAGSPQTKLVAFSGMPDDSLEAYAEAMGADAWLPKSASVDRLAALVARIA